MKNINFFKTKIFLLPFFVGCSLSFALPAPRYLSVPQWKKCIHTYKSEMASFICLPLKQPSQCPFDSWKKLKEGRLIQSCQRQ